MVNIQSMAVARKKVRDAQATAQEERARRERNNVEDVASFLVSRNKLAGVDKWEAERVAQVAAEAARRRNEHRRAGAAALARIRERGETIGAIAALAETTESEVRSYLKLARANAAPAGDVNGAAEDVGGAVSEPLGAAAPTAADVGGAQ